MSEQGWIDQQVRRARMRLIAQGLLDGTVAAATVGLLLASAWFVLRPLAFVHTGEHLRWAIAGALLGLAILAGIVVALVRTPRQLTAALALDRQFGLQERVTTLCSLSADQAASPAGQALLHDTAGQVKDLKVRERFPLTVAGPRLILLLGALTLAVAACLFDPALAVLGRSLASGGEKTVAKAKEIEQHLENIKKAAAAAPKVDDKIKSEELKKIEEEWNKLLQQPLDTKDEDKIRERVSEMRKLEDKMQDRINDLKAKTEKVDRLKKQLEQLKNDPDKQLKDGPAKDLEDALSKGDLQKAKEVLSKLAKDLKEQKVTPEQQQELAKEFQKMQEKLQRLMDNDDVLKQLKQNEKDGELDPEKLAQEMQNFKDLENLQDLVADASNKLRGQSGQEAGEELEKLLKRIEDAELTEAELARLIRDKDLLENASDGILQGICQQDGQAMANGMGQGKRPGGRRPSDPNDPNGEIKNERQKGEVDPRGQQRISGFVKGGNFSRIPAKAVDGAFQQAAQEGFSAIERQRIPDDAAELARGYFDRLRSKK